jgi:hypothetical protein
MFCPTDWRPLCRSKICGQNGQRPNPRAHFSVRRESRGATNPPIEGGEIPLDPPMEMVRLQQQEDEVNADENRAAFVRGVAPAALDA